VIEVDHLPLHSSENDNSLDPWAAGQGACAGLRNQGCYCDPVGQPEAASDDFDGGNDEFVGEGGAEDRGETEVGHGDGSRPAAVEKHEIDHSREGDDGNDWWFVRIVCDSSKDNLIDHIPYADRLKMARAKIAWVIRTG
jgi:hypothetical protein